ncbi:glycosyltransferase family 2 protein [Patescibacteria group bacterium]|nr:glycosyltransferase family 2 protein [Patescibacteria group bacterium]
MSCSQLIMFQFASKPTIGLSIIIVSWNVKDYLRNCLQSVIDSCQEINYEIIVIDNASKDESVKMVKKSFPQVKLIVNQDNLGFNKGNNQGIRMAKGQYLMLINPDTVVNKEAMQGLLDYLKTNQRVGIVGPEQLSERNRTVSTASRLSIRGNLEFTAEHLVSWLTGNYQIIFNKPYKVGILNGGCWLVRREVFEQVGLFNEDLFLFGEEPKFCYRTIRRRWEIHFARQFYIHHFRRKSIEQMEKSEANQFIRDYYNLIKNKLLGRKV